MKRLRLTTLLIAAGLASVGRADDRIIQSGAEQWLITSDIASFSVKTATVKRDAHLKYPDLISPGANDVAAGAKYEDKARRLIVYVGVFKFTNAANLDDAIEAQFRDNRTARFSSKVSLVSIAGHSVYFFCMPGPDCDERLYVWRSGTDTSVEISVDAFEPVHYDSAGSPTSRQTFSPEPSEVLEAYLGRFPSALEQRRESGQRRREFRRREVSHALDALERQLDEIPTLAPRQRHDALMDARAALVDWAALRQAVYGRPDAESMFVRVSALAALPEDTQLRMLNEIRGECRTWLNQHTGGWFTFW